MLIRNPSLGVLNLIGPSAEASVHADLEEIKSLFQPAGTSTTGPPNCDVLLVYCDIGHTGRIRNTTHRLREIVQMSGASMVIVANDHPVEAYIAAAPPSRLGRTNLIMTLCRKGNRFPQFLHSLFSGMETGIDLPSAWNTVTARISPDDLPEAIFANEIDPITFAMGSPKDTA